MYVQLFNSAIVLDFADIIADKNTNIHTLVKSTFNTWQKNRSDNEKTADTIVGKIAEYSVSSAFRILNIPLYHSYDSFRNDNFKLHAPFDALICKELTPLLTETINQSVKQIGPKLNPNVRKQIRKLDAFTVEIKSTRLANKYKERANFNNYDSESNVQQLILELNKLDFLTYPYFFREGSLDFNGYCTTVKRKFNFSENDEELRNKIIQIEKENADDIYIRVFVDEDCKKVIIMGWIDKKTFFENPKLMKLIQKNKSENALYYVCPIRKARPLTDINSLLQYYIEQK